MKREESVFTKKANRLILSLYTILFCIVLMNSGEIIYAQDGDSTVVDSKGLDGLWEARAVDYDKNDNPSHNMIVDINDLDALSDLYDGYTLTLDSDGTFEYKMGVFIEKGSYINHPSIAECYILKTEESYRLSFNDENLEKIEADSNTNYILEVCDDSLHLQEYDAFTGKAKANDNGIYFVKSEEDSEYIQDNKVEIQANNSSSDKDSSDSHEYTPNSSYEDILQYYTSKMEDTVPTLIDEYYRDAYGISDIEQLAEICNEKVSELAEICNEGVEKMADLMYEKNDSYETYSDWADKLMNNYIEISQGIQDAYLDSVM